MASIVADIETVGPAWSELSAATQDYLLGRCRDDAERAALPDRTALIPGLRRIVAIGLWAVESDRGIALVDDAPARPTSTHPIGETGFPRVPGAKIYRSGEADILAEFWRRLPAKGFRLITFRGRTFDAPAIMVRCAQLGVRCMLDLVGYRFAIDNHCDLDDCLCFMGATRDHYTLAHWCEAFGVPSPKSDVTGADVGRLYAEGRCDDIAEYVLGDCRAEAELYRRMTPMLAPLKGGPAPIARTVQRDLGMQGAA